MAEHYGFFNGEQEYGQDEFCRYFDSIYESGISVDENNTLTFGVTKEGNSLKVSKGFSIVKGFYLYNDSVKNINITKDNTYDRIDRIVVRLNLSTSKVSIEHKQGVPGSKPQVPAIQRDNLIYELSLAQVLVANNGLIEITDERHRHELCGAIRPKSLSEFNLMIQEFTKQFDKWFDSQQSKGWRNIFIQSDAPAESVAGSIWIHELT